MNEAELVQLVSSSLQNQFPHTYINKNHGDIYQSAGRPDLEGCILGRHFGFELKTKSRFKPMQIVHLQLIKRAGGIAGGIVHLKGKTYFLTVYDIEKYSWRHKDRWQLIGNTKKIDFTFLYKYLNIFYEFYHGEQNEHSY